MVTWINREPVSHPQLETKNETQAQKTDKAIHIDWTAGRRGDNLDSRQSFTSRFVQSKGKGPADLLYQ